MTKKLFTVIILLLLSYSSYSQLYSLIDPIRKTEAQIRSMMTMPMQSKEHYENTGKILFYEYADYYLYFTFIKDRCISVWINSKNDETFTDKMMYEFLYKHDYESQNDGKLWSKMIPDPWRNAVYIPMGAQKRDKKNWCIYDVLYYQNNN
jgi:hypothetical protein